MHSKLKLLTSCFATITFAVSAIGEEKVQIKQTLQSGKTYVIEQEMKMNSQIPLPGSDETMEQNMQMDMGMEMSVSNPKPAEKAVAIKYTAMKMTMDMMGQTIVMDATDPAQKETLGPILEMKPVLVYDNDDNLLRSEGLEVLGANNPLAGAVDPESLKQMVSGMMGDFPKEAIAPGHKWESKMDLPMPANMGKMKITIKNEFKKFEEIDGAKCAVISFTGTLGGEVAQQGMAVEFKKGSTFSGVYHFDPKIGYSRKQDIKMKMIMGMAAPDGGVEMEIPMSINQTLRLVKVRDN